jgi:hypothetical protein
MMQILCTCGVRNFALGHKYRISRFAKKERRFPRRIRAHFFGVLGIVTANTIHSVHRELRIITLHRQCHLLQFKYGSHAIGFLS